MKLWSTECKGKQNGAGSEADVAPKILSFLDLLAVGVGSSLGVGIAVLVGGLIKNVTGPAVVVSIALAGLAALLAGLCFAEYGVRFLKVNSAYAYSYIWSSESSAFVLGWALILQYVACSASAAKGIITFIDALADYKVTEFLNKFVSTDFSDVFPYFDFFSLVVAAAVTILYVLGKKDSIVVKKIFMTCNAVFIAFVIIIGAFKADVNHWEVEETPAEDGFAPFGVIGIVKGAAIGFYGYIGFDEIVLSGGEVKKRKRNLPLAILATIIVTLLAFGGVGAVLTLMLPYYKLNPHAAVPFAFQEMGWTALKWIAAVASFFGFQTSLFGATYSLPRIIQAMANDGLLFHCLGNSHSVSKIPLAAAMVGGLVTAVAAGIFPFETLVNVAVVGALVVYTDLAISSTLFRYSPKLDTDDKLSESCMNLINNDPDVSMKAVMQNYFNFKEKQPTILTKIIIIGNVVIFCLSSFAVSVIFIYFYDSLFKCDYAAVIPAGILLCAMTFNLISMTCQPKRRESFPFRVPLIPFVPCLSIFLNIFLMVTFESLTWILFSSWMALGLIPHFAWRLLKYLKGETGENSLYEINRTNALKLNESIWKIKRDKKSFYEGATNPAFADELEDKINANSESEVKKHNEKTALQLRQAEIIQTAEAAAEEKGKALERELEINFIRVHSADIVNDLQEENVQWECVAEIHTEEEFSQENVALEIVDNTYNFLSEVSDELLKNEANFKESDSGTADITEKSEINSKTSKSNSPLSEKHDKYKVSKPAEKTGKDLLEGEFFRQPEINNKNNEENLFPEVYWNKEKNLKNNISEENLNETLKESSKASKDPKTSVDILNKVDKSDRILNPNATGVENPVAKDAKSVPDERSKIKDFKEKLNKLLKNQVNGDSASARNSLASKPAEIAEANNQNKSDFNNSIKTLTKSEIRGKLELLLAKGPSKRPSLGSSFNIKVKEPDKEKELEKTNDEVSESQKRKALNSQDNFALSSTTLQESIKEKILLLKKAATNNRTTDISC